MKMQKGVTPINTARPEEMHEAEMLEVLRARPDFSYLFEVPPKNAEDAKAHVGDMLTKRVIFTKKKMSCAMRAQRRDSAITRPNSIQRRSVS